MSLSLNETHDPARRSFVESANAPGCDFPIQNLPFGVYRPASAGSPRVGVAIGDQIVDVAAAGAAFDGQAAAATRACQAPALNQLMSLGPQAGSTLRLALSRALSAEQGNEKLRQHLSPMAQAEILLLWPIWRSCSLVRVELSTRAKYCQLLFVLHEQA